jgi:quercetin dioxygenase-like cupin family protein
MAGDSMPGPYVFIPNFADHARLPENGILSRTVQNDDRSKIIQFCFAPGQELSVRTAPFPATIYIVQGEAELQLGPDRMPVQAGAFAYMPAQLEHAIRAKTEVVMLLTLLKNPSPA